MTSPLSFTGIKNVITVKELFVMKVGLKVKGLFLQLGRLVQPIAIVTSIIQPIWLPLLLPRRECNPGV